MKPLVAACVAFVLSLGALAFAVGAWQSEQGDRAAEEIERQVANCELGNEQRAAIVAGFEAFTDALAAVPPSVPRSPAEQARFEERLAAFRADVAERLEPLGPRDCAALRKLLEEDA